MRGDYQNIRPRKCHTRKKTVNQESQEYQAVCKLRKRMAAGREFLHIHCVTKRQTALSTLHGETKTDNPSYLQSHRQAHGTAGSSGSSVLILRARQCSFCLEQAVGTEVEVARMKLWGCHVMKGDVKTKALNKPTAV